MDSEPVVGGDQSPENFKNEPVVGQLFQTIDEAYVFYNSYAKNAGFSTRLHSSKKRKGTDEVIWRTFVCSKQGATNESYHQRMYGEGSSNQQNGVVPQPERSRGTTRVGCKAKMSIVKTQIGEGWTVSAFTNEHNHVLATPSKVPFLRSHRKVSEAKKNLSSLLALANVPASQRFAIMEIEAGGLHNVGCTSRDLLNHDRNIREQVRGHDAETLYEFFLSEKEKNPSFYFAIDKDGQNRMTRCFWADATARRSYSFFGDVVVFDTTYNTNKYCMMFAPFVGVNHHGQSILFGSGFLSDETTESFVWLFNQWLCAMPASAPNIIITDQDPAIAKAINIAVPTTFHRLCLWHITNKFSDKIGVANHIKFWSYFKNSIWASDTPNEFEESWQHSLDVSGLGEHEWLRSMFHIRHNWIPAYVNHIFSAGMTTSQRAESAHSFFKKCLSKDHSLIEFITRYNRSIGHQRHKELLADYIDLNETPRMLTRFPMEQQMSAIYTKSIFKTFQAELLESQKLVMQLDDDNSCTKMYSVRDAITVKSKVRVVSYDVNSDYASCSCHFFDVEGIPCRHLLVFLRSSQIVHLPDRYILSRWSKAAKVGRVWDDHGVEVSDVMDRDLLNRHARLSHKSVALIDDASLSLDGTDFLCNAFDNLQIKVHDMNKTKLPDICVVGHQVPMASDAATFPRDPMKAKAKGSGKRLKSGKERNIPKGRRCNACGERGVSHDKRNCPNIPNR